MRLAEVNVIQRRRATSCLATARILGAFLLLAKAVREIAFVERRPGGGIETDQR
jgi:hypothetical protein